jgi:cell wall assembly regulator SMI1
MPTRIHATLERLERWLREHEPAFLDAMRPGATDAELDDLQRALGCTLPEDVRAFYRWRAGITEVACGVGRSPFAGRPMTLAEIRGSYELCNRKFGKRNTEDQPAWWHAGWIPVFDLDSGIAFLCIDTAGAWTGVRGQIVRFYRNSEVRDVLAASLGDHLRALVIGLERDRTSAEDQLSPFNYPQEHYSHEDPLALDPPPPAPRAKPEPDAFRVGDLVRIIDGPFRNMEGPIERVNAGTWTLSVTLTFWGRPIDVELEPRQLEVVTLRPQPTAAAPQPAAVWNEAADAVALFDLLGFAPSVRKFQLFVAACYHDWLGAGDETDLLCDALERFADGLIDTPALRGALEDFWLARAEPGVPASEGFGTLYHAAAAGAPEGLVPHIVRGAAPELVREIFLNPFRPVAFDLAWRTSDVAALARGIYDRYALDGLPVLADALQEAGCDNDDLLNHLRDTSRPHVRGCWALDLVLGLE